MVAFLNALYVADRYHLQFHFTWHPMGQGGGFHVVPPASQIFSSDYLQRHGIGDPARTTLYEWTSREVSHGVIEEALNDPLKSGVDVAACSGELLIDGEPPAPGILPKLWSTIEFSSRMNSLAAAARRRVSAGTTAIHIRRGDLVTGHERFALHNAKYAPLAWWKHILRSELDKGRRVLIFSDDGEMVEVLCSRFSGALSATSLRLFGLSPFERDFFDLMTMSACDRVVAQASGFSILATMISGTQSVGPQQLIDARLGYDTVLADIDSNPGDYTKLARAKDIQWIALQLRGVNNQQKESLLRAALELDPENVTYARLLAIDAAANGRYDLAEAWVAGAIEAAFLASGNKDFRLWSVGRKTFGPVAGPIPIPPPGDARYPYLSSFSAQQRRSELSKAASAIIAKEASAQAPGSALLLARYASALVEAKQLQEAQSLLERAVAESPTVVALRLLLMRVAQLRGDASAAAQHGEIALEISPCDDLRVSIAKILLGAGTPDRALEVLDRVDLQRLTSADVLFDYSKAAAAVRDVRRARQAAAAAAELKPESAPFREWSKELGPSSLVGSWLSAAARIFTRIGPTH